MCGNSLYSLSSRSVFFGLIDGFYEVFFELINVWGTKRGHKLKEAASLMMTKGLLVLLNLLILIDASKEEGEEEEKDLLCVVAKQFFSSRVCFYFILRKIKCLNTVCFVA